MREKKKVVFILGPGHCGSTLIDLILGSHSQAFSLGEVRYLSKVLYQGFNKHSGICGICNENCSFWEREEIKPFLKSYFKDSSRVSGILMNEISPFRTHLYSHLFQWTQSQIIIDSSKSLHWIRKQNWPAYQWKEIEPVLLFVVRDGRAIVNSLIRKYPEKGIKNISRYWKRIIRNMQRYYDRYPKNRKLLVRYEEFASSPETVIHSICNTLDMSFESDMLEYWKHDHHLINANLGTKSLIFKYKKDKDKAQADYWKKKNSGRWKYAEDYYNQIGLNIKLDMRWKEEMSREDLSIFNRIAGNTNKRYAHL